jgi:hypothetical protein
VRGVVRDPQWRPAQTLQSGHLVTISRRNVFSGMLELNPSLWQTAIFVEAKIDFKIANRRSLVPIILNPAHDKVSGVHLEDAIETWLICQQYP